MKQTPTEVNQLASGSLEKSMKAVKVIKKPSKEMIELVIDNVSEHLASVMASFPDANIIYNEHDKPIFWRGEIEEGQTFGESEFERIPLEEFPALFLKLAQENMAEGVEPFDWEPAFTSHWPPERRLKFYECQKNMKNICLFVTGLIGESERPANPIHQAITQFKILYGLTDEN